MIPEASTPASFETLVSPADRGKPIDNMGLLRGALHGIAPYTSDLMPRHKIFHPLLHCSITALFRIAVRGGMIWHVLSILKFRGGEVSAWGGYRLQFLRKPIRKLANDNRALLISFRVH
jgi:hypothetical protein